MAAAVSAVIEHVPDEALTLLVDAMKALQTKMVTATFSAGDVLQMMCRLSPDFDLEAYGFRNFQSLCEKAVHEHLVEMEFIDGTWHNLKLPTAKTAGLLQMWQNQSLLTSQIQKR